jgi:putative lipoprotein
MNDDETAPSAAAQGQVTGTVAFRERIILRPGTIVEVSLLQTSPADAAATELAKQVMEDPGSPPIPFALNYDKSAIDERLEYSVRAVVKRGDRLLLTTDTRYPVLTRGAGNSVDLMLVAPARSAATPDAPLANTYWRLTSLGGEAYSHQSKNREPHIKFSQADERLSGFTGCNEFTSSYSLDGNTLALGEVAATQKACIEGMDIEQPYLQALRKVNRYRISGNRLQLIGADGPVLEFEAVYLQ